MGITTPAAVERTATQTADGAFMVHQGLAQGLLESVYETCLEYKLYPCGLKVLRQLSVPIVHDGNRPRTPLRCYGLKIL